MSAVTVNIPDSLKDRIERMAEEDGVPVDSLILTILSQRVAVADAESYVKMRGRRGGADSLKKILERAPDVEPDPKDRILTDNKASQSDA
jgi:hypothetical protein